MKLSCDPPFKSFGSKRRLAADIIRHLGPVEYRRYVEPFAGSAALFYALEPERALLSDIDPEPMRAHAAIKETPAEYLADCQRLAALNSDFDEKRRVFAELVQRRKDGEMISPAEWNWMGMVSLYGNLSTFSTCVPNTGKFLGSEQFAEMTWRQHEILHGAAIYRADYQKIKYREGDLVFFDPPYFRSYNSAYKHKSVDHHHLIALAKGLRGCGCTVVISASSTSHALFAGLPVEQLRIKYRGRTGDRRNSISRELLTILRP